MSPKASLSAALPKTDIASLVRNSRSAMLAAVEIHNKPIFEYRYEVVTLLVINAWELLLKAFIGKTRPSVNLVRADGTTKEFLECVACVSAELRADFEVTRHNLERLYEYRNEVAHFYPKGMDVLVFSLLRCSVVCWAEFLEKHFGEKIEDHCNLVLLPIGFRTPISPVEFLSSRSASDETSKEVTQFLKNISESSQSLLNQGIADSMMVNFSMNLINETRIKNADLIAGIATGTENGNALVIKNVVSAFSLTNNPAAKELKLSEESVFQTLFTETHAEVAKKARTMFSDFSQNQRFNEIMRKCKQNPSICRVRLLNPKNPKSSQANFYSSIVYEELAKHYKKRSNPRVKLLNADRTKT
jgi:hypothetical protein